MPLKTPRFWSERGLAAYLLLPFSYLYLAGYKIKEFFSKPYSSIIPVVCVGGIVAGGSGKTPVVHALLKIIREQELFLNPVVLTRGYGGSYQGPSLVDPQAHIYHDVGDESLLHAMHAPTIVSKDRPSGARLAEAMGADIIIMDDGLQNNSLAKTLSFLVLDAKQKTGNGYLIPAGPLREPLMNALNKCAAIIQTNGTTNDFTQKPVLGTRLSMTSSHDMGKTYFGFAGLGTPDKFQKTLEDNGFNLSGFKSFSDHHPYDYAEMENLMREAGNSRLITTAKDIVRIPYEYRDHIDVLEIQLSFEEPDKIIRILKNLS